MLWWCSCKWCQVSEGCDSPALACPILCAQGGEEGEPQDVRITFPDGRRKWLHAAGHHFSVLGLTGGFVVITDETEEVKLLRAAQQSHRIEAVGALAGELSLDIQNHLSVGADDDVLALYLHRL